MILPLENADNNKIIKTFIVLHLACNFKFATELF